MSRATLVARWGLLLVTALVLQVGVMAQFPVFGVVGDLMAALTIGAALVGGAERGAIVGFWSGLLFDLARPGVLGVSSLAYCVVGFGVGLLAVAVIQFGRPMAMTIVALGSSIATLLFAAIAEVFGEHTMTNPYVWRIVAVVGLVNGIIAPLVIGACRLAESDHEPVEVAVPGVGNA